VHQVGFHYTTIFALIHHSEQYLEVKKKISVYRGWFVEE